MVSIRARRTRLPAVPGRAGLLVFAAAALLVISACGSGGGQPGSAGGSGAADSRAAGSGAADLQATYERVVRQVLPSVVEIDAGASTGSGVVFDSQGDIVTNAHVLADAKTIAVKSSMLSAPLTARVVGVFAPDDLAVIKVDDSTGDLQAPRWADSAKIQVGQIVLAMGSPYGLADSVTQGIVSATARTVTGPPITGPGPQRTPMAIADAIQTSAAINPGNSGGALVLLTGYVAGIPTLTARDPEFGGRAEGIGFAIPSNTVRNIATQLIDKGKVTTSDRAALRITGRTHTDSASAPDGVTVDAVQPGGAASDAGIAPGDVIVGLGGHEILNISQLENALVTYRPGEKVTIEVLRNGNPKQFTVTLASLIS